MDNSRKSMWALIIVVLVVIVVMLLVRISGMSSAPTGTASSVQTIQATYSCDAGKTIQATYENATSATTTGNAVMLVLSDGRQMTLPQTISADGARYSNGNPQVAEGQPGAETFVFWSKGNGAFVQENGTTTYDNCLTQNS